MDLLERKALIIFGEVQLFQLARQAIKLLLYEEKIRMRFFYVDYENRKKDGLNGIAKLTSSDNVKIYYSEDAQTMTFGAHRRIMESKANFEYRKMDSAMKGVKNLLDVLLMHDLDSIMKDDKNREHQYFIVSEDKKDFDGFVNEKSKKYRIYRISEVCKASACVDEINSLLQSNKKTSQTSEKEEKELILKKKEQVFRSFFGKSLKSKYEEHKENIIEAYLESSTKQEFNNKLQQYFYNEDVSYILEVTKNFTKDWPGR